MTPVGTPVRPSAPRTPVGNSCYHCGEVGHYANNFPKRTSPNTPVQNQQMLLTQNPHPASSTQQAEQS
jgi:hypothetical protein